MNRTTNPKGFAMNCIKFKRMAAILVFFMSLLSATAHAQNLLGLNVVASADTIPSGASISYLIQIRNSSIINDAVNAKLQIQLPPETDYALVESNIYVQSSSLNTTTDIFTINLVSPFRAGVSTELYVTAKINHTANLQNFSYDVRFTLNADNASSLESVIQLTIRPPGLAFSIQKYGSRSVYLNSEYSYTFKIYGTSGLFEEIQSITLVDTLAEGIEIVSKPSSLIWDPATRILTMDRPKSSPSVEFAMSVRFPDTYFKADQRIYNTAHLIVKFSDGTEWKYKSTWYVDLVFPITIAPTITLTKQGPKSNIMVGASGGKWNISASNNGDVPSYQIVVSDTLPGAGKPSLLFVTGLIDINATIYYQTYDAPGTWFSVGKNYSDRMWYVSNNLPNIYKINIVKLVIQSLPGKRSVNFEIQFNASGSDWDGTSFQLPLVVNNCATLDHHWPDGTIHTIRSCSWFNLTPIALKPFVSISASSATINAGDVFSYTLNLTEQTQIYTRLMTPVTAILLPPQVEYQSWNRDPFLWGYNGVPTPQVDIINNYKGSGRTLVRFDWRPTNWGWLMMTAYRNIRMTVTVKAKRNLIPQTFAAHYHLLYIGNTAEVIESMQKVADQYDLNDNGLTNDIVYRSSPISVSIRAVVGLQAEEFVKGPLDPTWTKYPDYADTYAGGTAEYKIVLTNTGSIPMGNFKMMTILPYIGDISVIGSQPRESAWRPILTGPVTIVPDLSGNPIPGDVQVSYSLSGNPQRTEFDPTGPVGAEPPNWTTSFPGSETKSVYFNLGSLIIYGGESVIFTWQMQVPEDAPKGSVAWSSFAYRGQRMDNNSVLLPSEAHKVGVANLWTRLTKTDNQEVINEAVGIWYTIDYAYNELTEAGNAYLLEYVPPCMHLFYVVVNNNYNSNFSEISPGVIKIPLGRLVPGQVGQVKVYMAPRCFQEVFENCVALFNNDTAIVQACDATRVNPVIIGDYVWYDEDEDGIQDINEKGIPNAVVNLYVYSESSTGIDKIIRQTTKTDVNGYYQFMDFPFNLLVEVDVKSLPYGFKRTSSQDLFKYTSYFLTSNRRVDNADFGYVATVGTIGDYVWFDRDDDGLQDPEEQGLPGVILRLYTDAGKYVSKTITNADGRYLFKNVFEGRYRVVIDAATVPEDFRLTTVSDIIDVTMPVRGWYRDADFGYYTDAPNRCNKRIMAWYQPGYGDSTDTPAQRLWSAAHSGGHADTSLFDAYSCQSAAMWEYQILQAWSAGIDGFVVDWRGRDSYENTALRGLLNSAQKLHDRYQQNGFNFQIAVSYHEKSTGTLEDNFTYLADSILVHDAYWGRRNGDQQPLYLYDTEMDLLPAKRYRQVADSLLPAQTILGWNQADTSAYPYMDFLYPWVQALPEEWDDVHGLHWGEAYLDSFYIAANREIPINQLQFVVGSVWPGYDERDWVESNTNHWMARQDTAVYAATWKKALDYNKNLPLLWILVESWNDYNRGSEIEWSLEWQDKFLVATRDWAQIYKESCYWQALPNMALEMPRHLYQARQRAKLHGTDLDGTKILDSFFAGNYYEAVSIADLMAGIMPMPMESVQNDTCCILQWNASEMAEGYILHHASSALSFLPGAPVKPDTMWLGNVTQINMPALGLKNGVWIAVTAVDKKLGRYANQSWFENSLSGASIRPWTNCSPISAIESGPGNALIFVSGSETYQKSKESRDWTKAVDGVTEGWAGTTWARGDASAGTPAMAIFRFRDGGIYQFNRLKLTTDNGSDDDKSKHPNQVRLFRVWVSTTGMEALDFASLGDFRVRFNGGAEVFKLGRMVQARYLRLELLDPNYYSGGWMQLVEFGVDTDKKQGAVPATEETLLAEVPTEYALLQNHPNPFNAQTTMEFSIPQADHVELKIYDVHGREVAELIDGGMQPGEYRVDWQAGNLPSGVYFYRLQTQSGQRLMRKMILVK